jgi:RimJ/RimL family protein N-acetyltransferase
MASGRQYGYNVTVKAINLKTERLTIRPLVPSDAESLFSYRSLAEASRFQSFRPETIEDAMNFISLLAAEPGIPASWYQMAVVLNESERHIGDIGIHFLENPDEVELGCTIAPELWGKGYATESLKAIIAYVFGSLKKKKVIADISQENTRSCRLFEHLGFQLVSQTEDGVIYRLPKPAVQS